MVDNFSMCNLRLYIELDRVQKYIKMDGSFQLKQNFAMEGVTEVSTADLLCSR